MNKELYQYRKDNGLCVNCGDRAVMGKTRCISCAQIDAVKAKYREENRIKDKRRLTAYRKQKNKYLKEWREKNPDKVAVYKSRKSEYNKRYKEGYTL